MMTTRKLIITALLLLLAACAPQRPVQVPQPLQDAGSLTVFLQPFPQEAHRLTFDIQSINARQADGTETSLVAGIPSLRADQLIGQQKKLISARLKPGRYTGLTIQFNGATLLGEDGETALLVPVEAVLADQDFSVVKGQATTLFLTLLPERIITDGFRLTPRFSLLKPQGLLISLKGFVSNPELNSLTMFDKKRFFASDTIAMGAQPKDVVLDQSRELLYVALSGDSAIDVVEINSAAIFGKINLRFGDDPTEIVLGNEGRTLVTINPGAFTSSICDTSSLIEVARVRFKSEPIDIFNSRNESRAFVLLPDTNSIVLLDFSMPRRPSTLSVPLDETPLRGIVGQDGDALYLLTRFTSNLLVLDKEALSISKRIYVGAGAEDLVEGQDGQIYVARRNGEIAIVDPKVAAVIDAFQVPRGVRFLKLDNEQNALFAVYPERGVVEKFDLTSKRSLGVFDAGKGAYAAAFMGEKL